MPRTLIVGGTFDRAGGRPSKIVATLAAATQWPALNGGSLEAILAFDPKLHDVLVWMPNINNDEDKLLGALKQKNPKLTLVSSKRIVEKNYSDFDVVGRLLKSHSALGIAIRRSRGYRFQLIDPLGNVFCDTQSVPALADALVARVTELVKMTRIGSRNVGTAPATIVGIDDFVDVVRQYGDAFSRHVNAINPERFLGNASARPTERITRCCHGFPGMRHDACYLISRRNVNKERISATDFVAVETDETAVQYHGYHKPSVDAAIQIRLFNFYRNVNFIVHGHVYVENAPMTASKIPCGHIEEFDEIAALATDELSGNFSVNLRGHGCLILAEDLSYLKQRLDHLKSRPFLET